VLNSSHGAILEIVPTQFCHDYLRGLTPASRIRMPRAPIALMRSENLQNPVGRYKTPEICNTGRRAGPSADKRQARLITF